MNNFHSPSSQFFGVSRKEHDDQIRSTVLDHFVESLVQGLLAVVKREWKERMINATFSGEWPSPSRLSTGGSTSAILVKIDKQERLSAFHPFLEVNQWAFTRGKGEETYPVRGNSP